MTITKYLLITAMLVFVTACNETVNEKFIEIDTINRNNISLTKDSVLTIIENNRHILELEEIQLLASNLDKYMKDFRLRFINHLSEEYSGEKINLSNSKKQMEFTIGINKQGEGYILEKRLVKYINDINRISGNFSFEHIAKNGNEIDAFAGTENANKDFVMLSFGDIPASAACLSPLKGWTKL